MTKQHFIEMAVYLPERAFTLAGPLIRIDPETTIRGIRLRDYYHLHLYNALTQGLPKSLPMTEERSPINNFEIMDLTPAFSPLGVEITLQNGTIRKIYFKEMDGSRKC